MSASETVFAQALLRMKEQLGIESDKAIAEVLGLSPTGFADRKRRGAFPEDKLFALATKRPELGIDVHYVLHGESAKDTAAKMLLAFPGRVRDQRGSVPAAEFAARLGVGVEELVAVEAGQRKPSPDFHKRFVANFPDMSPVFLSGGDEPTLDSPLTHAEVHLVRNYRQSSDEGQAALRHHAVFFREYRLGRLK